MAARMKQKPRGIRSLARKVPGKASRPAPKTGAAKSKAKGGKARGKKAAAKAKARTIPKGRKAAKKVKGKARPKAKPRRSEAKKPKAKAKPSPPVPPTKAEEVPLDQRLGTEWLLDLMERRGLAPTNT